MTISSVATSDSPSPALAAAIDRFPSDAARGYLAVASIGLPTKDTVAALRADLDLWATGEREAKEYDAIYDGVFETEAAVARLRGLARDGAILEFGVGTGRLAIPLADSGLVVHGVDGSLDMLNLMAEKPNGKKVEATVGDFSTVSVPGEFALVVCATNTFYALPDQEAQLRCFGNAASNGL